MLFTLLPATGSLQPLLPVAAELKHAGHDVVFVSSATMASDVKECGYAFVGAGLAWHASDPDYVEILCRAAGGPAFPALTGPERFAWVTDILFIGAAARHLVPDLLGIAKDWHPDLIVRESLEFAGCVVAERIGIPHASVAAAADCALDNQKRLATPLGVLRGDAGLPADTDQAMPYRHLHLCFAPPSFHGSDARFPSTARFFRHEPSPEPGNDQVGSGGRLARPRVLVSLGTVFHRTPGLIETITEALCDLPIDIDLALGFDQDPSRLGVQPPNVHVASWLPIPQLLPSCDLFVTHGGFNSVKEALAAGVPMVVIPIAGDQPYAASRCRTLGVAQVVDAAERTVDRIRDAARRVLQDGAYLARATVIRDEIAGLPTVKEAILMLEALVGSATPPRRGASSGGPALS
ncbi:MAG: glycosyltransferase [Acidimicrobiales bacterium]